MIMYLYTKETEMECAGNIIVVNVIWCMLLNSAAPINSDVLTQRAIIWCPQCYCLYYACKTTTVIGLTHFILFRVCQD